MGPLSLEHELYLVFCLPMDPLAGLPCLASVGEEVLNSVGIRSPKVGWYPKEASPSLRRRGVHNAFVRVGLRGEEAGGCGQD